MRRLRNEDMLKHLIFIVAALCVVRPIEGAEIDFDRDIAPLLTRRCLHCHAGEVAEGKLDLSRKAAALAGGESGVALKPGDVASSLIWRRVAAGEMPEDAMRREMREEMQLDLAELYFHAFLAMSGGRGIVIAFRSSPVSGCCDALIGYDDVAEARWFGKDSLPPHDQLAFDTTISLLAAWLTS